MYSIDKKHSIYLNKNNIILRKNLTKEVKDLYDENYGTLMKLIKEDTDKWKDILSSWIGGINILKCPYYPKYVPKVYFNSYQNPSDILYKKKKKQHKNSYGQVFNIFNRSGFVESYDGSVFNFLRNYHTFF